MNFTVDSPARIVANGDYDILVQPGQKHLMAVKGTWGGATVTMYTWNAALLVYDAVENGAWTNDEEQRFYPPDQRVRFTVTGASGATELGLTVTPLK